MRYGEVVIEVKDPIYFTPPPLVDAGSDPSEWLSYVPKKTPWLLLAALAAGGYYLWSRA